MLFSFLLSRRRRGFRSQLFGGFHLLQLAVRRNHRKLDGARLIRQQPFSHSHRLQVQADQQLNQFNQLLFSAAFNHSQSAGRKAFLKHWRELLADRIMIIGV